MAKQKSLPKLAVIIKGGFVHGVVSDQPEALAQMLSLVIVIDFDYADGQIVTDKGGRQDIALVFPEPVKPSEIDLNVILRDLAPQERKIAKIRARRSI